MDTTTVEWGIYWGYSRDEALNPKPSGQQVSHAVVDAIYAADLAGKLGLSRLAQNQRLAR